MKIIKLYLIFLILFWKILHYWFCLVISFQILSEIRHWFWDLGYGFELKTSKITGALVIIGSIISHYFLYSLRGLLL